MLKAYRAWQLRREVAAYWRGYNWAAGRLLAGDRYYRIEVLSDSWKRVAAPSREYCAHSFGMADAVARWYVTVLKGKPPP